MQYQPLLRQPSHLDLPLQSADLLLQEPHVGFRRSDLVRLGGEVLSSISWVCFRLLTLPANWSLRVGSSTVGWGFAVRTEVSPSASADRAGSDSCFWGWGSSSARSKVTGSCSQRPTELEKHQVRLHTIMLLLHHGFGLKCIVQLTDLLFRRDQLRS